MTFVEYVRARRRGLALKSIRSGEKIINTQLASGYDSSSGFRETFSRIIGAAPTRLEDGLVLKASWLDTQLGPMVAIADENELYLLEFVDRRGLEREVERLRTRMKAAIVPGQTIPNQSIERELAQYFEGTLTEFKTPVHLIGSPFQQSVWEQLRQIPPGGTRSYAEIARTLGKPTAYRAVAQANGANQLAIIIPCHRVINVSGGLSGYGGGVARKEWLLNHEKTNKW